MSGQLFDSGPEQTWGGLDRESVLIYNVIVALPSAAYHGLLMLNCIKLWCVMLQISEIASGLYDLCPRCISLQSCFIFFHMHFFRFLPLILTRQESFESVWMLMFLGTGFFLPLDLPAGWTPSSQGCLQGFGWIRTIWACTMHNHAAVTYCSVAKALARPWISPWFLYETVEILRSKTCSVRCTLAVWGPFRSRWIALRKKIRFCSDELRRRQLAGVTSEPHWILPFWSFFRHLEWQLGVRFVADDVSFHGRLWLLSICSFNLRWLLFQSQETRCFKHLLNCFLVDRGPTISWLIRDDLWSASRHLSSIDYFHVDPRPPVEIWSICGRWLSHKYKCVYQPLNCMHRIVK